MALAASVAQAVFEEDVLESAPPDSVTLDDPEQTRAAQKAWDIWVDEDESDATQSTTEAAITETLLGRALPILGRSGIGEPAELLSELLRFEPALTPQICAYIIEFASTGPRARTILRGALDKLVAESSFSVWQRIWLAEAAGSIRRAKNHHDHYDWLETCASDPNPALAATASAALGKLRRAKVDTLQGSLDKVGPIWRSLVLWGLARTDYDAAKLSADDRLERLLVAEVRQ